jgi:hypothetical protein
MEFQTIKSKRYGLFTSLYRHIYIFFVPFTATAVCAGKSPIDSLYYRAIPYNKKKLDNLVKELTKESVAIALETIIDQLRHASIDPWRSSPAKRAAPRAARTAAQTYLGCT